jgi:hypothetical protein
MAGGRLLPKHVSDEAIDKNPWTAVFSKLPENAGPQLVLRTGQTAFRLIHDCLEHKETAYTHEEADVWDGYTAAALEAWKEAYAANERIKERDARQETAAAAVETQEHGGPAETTTPASEPPRAAQPAIPVTIESPRTGQSFSEAAEQILANESARFISRAGDIEGEIETTAAQAEQAAHRLLDRAGRFARRFLDGLGDRFESAIHFFADMVSPPPKLTKDQAERAIRAADERQQDAADLAYHREQEAAADWQQFEENRNQQQAELGFAERYGTPPASRARDRERDDELER